MTTSFNDVVKLSLFKREEFAKLLETSNIRDVREELLEMDASIRSQLLNSPHAEDSEWLKRTKSLQVFVQRRLNQVNELLNEELVQWENLVLDLVHILDSEGLISNIKGFTLPNGKDLKTWYDQEY